MTAYKNVPLSFFVKLLPAIFFVTLTTNAWSASGERLKKLTNDYEVENLKIAYRADGIPSRVRFKTCSTCNNLDLKVSASASFIVDGKSVPLNQTRHLYGRSGAVIYNIENELVEKIIFF